MRTSAGTFWFYLAALFLCHIYFYARVSSRPAQVPPPAGGAGAPAQGEDEDQEIPDPGDCVTPEGDKAKEPAPPGPERAKEPEPAKKQEPAKQPKAEDSSSSEGTPSPASVRNRGAAERRDRSTPASAEKAAELRDRLLRQRSGSERPPEPKFPPKTPKPPAKPPAKPPPPANAHRQRSSAPSRRPCSHCGRQVADDASAREQHERSQHCIAHRMWRSGRYRSWADTLAAAQEESDRAWQAAYGPDKSEDPGLSREPSRKVNLLARVKSGSRAPTATEKRRRRKERKGSRSRSRTRGRRPKEKKEKKKARASPTPEARGPKKGPGGGEPPPPPDGSGGPGGAKGQVLTALFEQATRTLQSL